MSDQKLSNTIPQAVVPSEVGLTDALNLLKKDILLSLNCHHVGTIQEFDPETQTATATINYKKTYFQLNTKTKLYDPILIDYPPISCPVIFLGGGPGALTFPVATGDECLVLFNDRDMDIWFQGNPTAGVATPRLHSFSDGVILVGLRSQQNSLDNFDTVRVALRGKKDGTTFVGVGETLIKIANQNQNLGDLLQSLISELKTTISNIETLVSATAAITVLYAPGPGSLVPSGPPVNAAAITAVNTSLSTNISNLTTIASDLGGLIE